MIDVTEKMEPPVFVVKPVNKDVKEEGKATFECKVKGKPLPEVTWSVAICLLHPVIRRETDILLSDVTAGC